MPQNDCKHELIAPGEVWLVGAGPGDPDLLTRKAEKLILAADVVFYDALVGAGILDLIPDGVECVSVGKRSGRHSKHQQTIDEMLVAAALAQKRVVRLKGGDPALFARASEEITALRKVGVRVRICPGITAASAVAASAGLSLSLRGIARRVQFVTAHSRNGQALDLDWHALADPACTLAIYMGREAAPELSMKLIAAGLPGSTPALIACDASLPQEQQLRTRLDLLPLVAQAFAADRPTLILIGEAAAQADGTVPVSSAGAVPAACEARA
ncbi:uroporphyrinogen-III C-methyltransferase [Novosphingobium barchaimii LL02]|uniref:uroporphyrinogen-III C-methyltransferase n=1 Tax=Novosphingobium barchaimii LL02 TaxID=1114963 RepID=A0A0J7XIW4_9SPHN|nr:uroporphyrinogen-III C-methyltransferase [Novosphingobium barchaimii]KMS51971.1 uroporphyrinogen-III C-methyltransferase [Novosphingobium barchaimii LL02]